MLGGRTPKVKRYDLGKFTGKEGGQDVCEQYQEEVVKRANEVWPDEEGVQEKWLAVHGALTSAAEDVLGVVARRQPDWFRESLGELQPLLMARNKAYSRWLGTGKQEDLVKFREARGEARRAVRTAKNEWFLAKAEEVEREKFGGKKVWRCIRDMQRGRRGLIPSGIVAIHDTEGIPCTSTSAQYQHWRQHFIGYCEKDMGGGM